MIAASAGGPRAGTVADLPSTVDASPVSARLRLAGLWRDAFGALAVVVLVELLVLRLGTRTFIHIPGLDAAAGPLSAVSDFGRFAYYLSVALLLAALLVAGSALAGSRNTASRMGLAGIVLLVVGGCAGLAGMPIFSTIATLTAVMLCAPAAACVSRARLYVVGAFVVGFMAFGLHALTQIASQAGLGSLRVTWLLGFGEIATTVFAVATPLLVRSTKTASSGRLRSHGADLWAIGAGVGLAVLVAALRLSGTATGQILSLWNFGLAGFLPGVLYVAAAGSLAYSGVALFRAGRRGEAAALALLVAGGAGMHSTYQSGLVVAGLVLFALVDRTPVQDHTERPEVESASPA
ncbi:MAG: hypothetical protein IT198_14300 [Acidimicrobiia bacterium]|nr:hypothetical protein [Acidimicrobiia bacterium]